MRPRLYFYLNADRIGSFYSQLEDGLLESQAEEWVRGAEATLGSRLLSLLSLSGKASASHKVVSDKRITAEKLLQNVEERLDKQIFSLENKSHWDAITTGALVRFKMPSVRLSSFTKDAPQLLRDAQPYGASDFPNDLRLTGKIGGRAVTVPFSPSWIVSPSLFSSLLHTRLDVAGLAVLMVAGKSKENVLQPLAFSLA